MKKTNLKILALAVPFLILASCSKTQEPDTSEAVSWDATNYVLFNEFMECVPGTDFSQEALDEMIAAWRDLGLSPDLLGAWGYAPASENNTLTNREWELSWSSQEAADLAWADWMGNSDAQEWSDKYESVMRCDGENRNGFEFVFPYDPYRFGQSPEDGSFAANFIACTLNEGQGQEELTNALIAYNNWLDGLNADAVGGFYAYGVYFPVDPESEVDYWYGNFHINMDGMQTGMGLWEDTGANTKAILESTGTCENPEIFQGQVFYDPNNPDFS